MWKKNSCAVFWTSQICVRCDVCMLDYIQLYSVMRQFMQSFNKRLTFLWMSHCHNPFNQIFKWRVWNSIISLKYRGSITSPSSILSFTQTLWQSQNQWQKKKDNKNLLKSKAKVSIRVQLEIRIVWSPQQLCHPLRVLTAYLTSPRIHVHKYRAKYWSHWLYFIIIFWVSAGGPH